MMRKPLVAISVAAVVLGAGTIVATRAGAQETPPGVPGFSLDDLDGWIAPVGADDEPADAVAGQDAVGQDAVGHGGAGHGGVGQDGVGHGPALDPPAASTHPAGQAPDAADQAADRPTGAPGRPGPIDRADAPEPASHGGRAATRHDVADSSSNSDAGVQRQVLALVNENRREHGCADLTLDTRLIEAANEHADDMARHDYFAHESRNGDGAGERVSDAGYAWRRYGENIARGADSAYAVVDGWMHSPEHRHNILDCRFDEMGVGLAVARDHTPYWVQDLATPR